MYPPAPLDARSAPIGSSSAEKSNERRSTDGRLPQFRCMGCGYGASCRMAPERCPMCGASTWELLAGNGSLAAGEVSQ